jgi:hypothetical protein
MLPANQHLDASCGKTSIMRPAAAIAFLLAASLLAIPAAANHPQNDSGKAVAFDHRTGNEWWVEVVLTGQDAGSVHSVQSMDEGGAWVSLTKRSWGAWAASYHVEPGNLVRFRATWADGAQQVSCWFTHPQGAEQCPGTWRATRIGEAGPSAGARDIAVGDVDGDGANEVVVPSGSGLWYFEWSARGWLTPMPISGLAGFGHVAVGDVEGDGRSEVYASRDGQVLRFERAGGAWTSRVVADFGIQGVGSMSLGDIEDDGLRELYVGLLALDGAVHRIHFDGDAWRTMEIARPSGGTQSMWLGDGDHDGDTELYVGEGWRGLDDVWQVDGRPGAWESTRIASLDLGTGVTGIVTGDADRDGRREVYATAGHPSAPLFRIRLASAGWQMDRVATLPASATDLFFADGENDGVPELYASASDGHVHQATGRATGWEVVDLVATPDPYLGTIAVGDGDNDGKVEAYVVGFERAGGTPNSVYQVAGHPVPPPPPTGFDATFQGVRGNEWWVQATVTSSGGSVSGVDVRLNGGAWRPLVDHGWGWARSYHVPEGTIVQLRAHATTGATDLSDCYRWIPPSGTDAAKTSCAPPAFDATFSGVKGNEWWVQANVAGNQPIASVGVRVDCAPEWRPLVRQSWGGWAASFHIPSGSRIDFQARTSTWQSDVSGGYAWPQATPTSGCPQGDWPRQGSFATYEASSAVCGGGNCERSEATFRTEHRDGRWAGVCDGTDTFHGVDGTVTTERWRSEHPGIGPVHLPTRTAVGAEHRPMMVHTSYDANTCSVGRTSSPVFVQGQEDKQTAMRDGAGNPVVLRTWRAHSTNPSDNFHTVNWELRMGLIVELASNPRMSQQGSEYMALVETDAKLT